MKGNGGNEKNKLEMLLKGKRAPINEMMAKNGYGFIFIEDLVA